MPGILYPVVLCLLAADAGDEIAVPRALDPRLRIELFAAEPQIVTPCGVAVDARGRVLVIESHTHFRPADYPGPSADRIRMFQDTDGDGRADRIKSFYEGTTYTMGIGLHPDGSLYVATRSEIFRLRDTDDDGAADQRTPIARLETQGDYPHNGLSGFAFDFVGNVYFGLGENLGAEFKLIGSDGSTEINLEGGQIYRCKADGSQVECVAFGFWNPFHLTRDAFGRLFAVDNDPDSMPPCRLIHVVEGGNYGYRYRNGRKGVHPFTAWNGELAGTLPMVAGTGEAPSAVVSYESDQLPADYLGNLLVTSWGDHRIERYRLERRGASFQALPETIIQGDENFRPVGLAVAPDGSLFASDWILRDYELHGKGRLWHITAPGAQRSQRPSAPREALGAAHQPLREGVANQLASDKPSGHALLRRLAAEHRSPRARAAALAALHSAGVCDPVVKAASADSSTDVRAAAVRLLDQGQLTAELLSLLQPPEVRAEAMRRATDRDLTDVLWEAVGERDAFVAQAARRGLARLQAVDAAADWSGMPPARRLASVLILRESRDPRGPQILPQLLRDADSDVKFAALQWVGEERLADLRGSLVDALTSGPATARLFGGYLAALERLDGVTRAPADEWAGQQYIARALDDPRSGAEVRRLALRMLRPDHAALSMERLRQFLGDRDRGLRLEAVRTLRDSRLAGREAVLKEIATSSGCAAELRAEAIVGLAPQDAGTRQVLISLAGDEELIVSHEALRSLRGCHVNAAERDALSQISGRDDTTAELVARVVEPDRPKRVPADDVAHWLDTLRAGAARIQGDARAGERIFFQRSAQCSRCHQVAGRGGSIGPELTATRGALAEERLVESIVRPSKEIAPQFVAWTVVTTTGKPLVGVLVGQEPTGEQTYADREGNLYQLKPDEIESRRPHAASIMPDGLAGQLTLQEFRDLVAYLGAP